MKGIGKTLIIGLSFSVLGVTAVSAQASTSAVDAHFEPLSVDTTVPVDKPVFVSVEKMSSEAGESAKVAFYHTSCYDDDPWWMYSGIEAATCLLSGQW